MMTKDPNRMMVIIRDRHVLIHRLEEVLKQAKADGGEDVFKVNRMIKHQKENLKKLEDDMKQLVEDHKALAAHKKLAIKQSEKREIDSLRAQLKLWDINK